MTVSASLLCSLLPSLLPPSERRERRTAERAGGVRPRAGAAACSNALVLSGLILRCSRPELPNRVCLIIVCSAGRTHRLPRAECDSLCEAVPKPYLGESPSELAPLAVVCVS